MNTITMSAIPDTLGARERMYRAARQQNADNRTHEAERAAKVEQNVSDLERLIDQGDLRAPVFFARRTNPNRATPLNELLWDAAQEGEGLPYHFLKLLVLVSDGVDATKYAQELRRLVILKAAEEQAE